MTPTELLYELERRKKYNKLSSAYPETGPLSRDKYFRQMEFFNATAKYKQVLFSASNRSGKTYSAAFIVTCHLTGLYPDWYKGHRFTAPNPWLIVGQTSLTTTAILQKELLGDNGDFGSGMIPKHLLDFDTLPAATKVGVSVSGFKVKHVSGGYSTVNFRSQEQGILSLVGVVANIWADEPLKLELYTELLTRTATIDGLFLCTATPILGFDSFLREFCAGEWRTGEINKHKYVVSQTWEETPHLSPDTIEMLLNSYPPHQRDCRSRGIPMMGSGAVYPVSEDMITTQPFEIPPYWKRWVGCDVGWKFWAAVWFAENPDTNEIFVTGEYKLGETIAAIHAENIKARGHFPIAIDTAAHGRSQNDGVVIYDQLADKGLDLHNADKAVEAGLWEVLELMTTGRLKIFSTCREVLKDVLNMSRDEKGKIIDKSSYHMADALRYGVTTRDIAKVPGGKKVGGGFSGRRW